MVFLELLFFFYKNKQGSLFHLAIYLTVYIQLTWQIKINTCRNTFIYIPRPTIITVGYIYQQMQSSFVLSCFLLIST